MPRLRLGVVVLAPPPVDREVDGLRRACGDGSLGRVPAHLTLVPPVNVREDRFAEALAVLRRAAEGASPFGLTLGPPATFLPDTPVLYLAVGGDLDALHGLRDDVFREPLARTLTWPFVPHVTLADGVDPGRIEAALVSLADYRAEIVVERLHVLQERRDDDGVRVWEPIADAALRPAAVIGRGGLPLEVRVAERLDPVASAWSDAAWAAYSSEQYGTDRVEEDLALTAMREGEVVGVAVGEVRGVDAYLANLIVAPEVRGQGVGSHLLAAFVSVAAERGRERVMLRTVAGGPAEAFYRRHGFVVHAPLPAWRHGRDFVQLRRDLV